VRVRIRWMSDSMDAIVGVGVSIAFLLLLLLLPPLAYMEHVHEAFKKRRSGNEKRKNIPLSAFLSCIALSRENSPCSNALAATMKWTLSLMYSFS